MDQEDEAQSIGETRCFAAGCPVHCFLFFFLRGPYRLGMTAVGGGVVVLVWCAGGGGVPAFFFFFFF